MGRDKRKQGLLDRIADLLREVDEMVQEDTMREPTYFEGLAIKGEGEVHVEISKVLETRVTDMVKMDKLAFVERWVVGHHKCDYCRALMRDKRTENQGYRYSIVGIAQGRVYRFHPHCYEKSKSVLWPA